MARRDDGAGGSGNRQIGGLPHEQPGRARSQRVRHRQTGGLPHGQAGGLAATGLPESLHFQNRHRRLRANLPLLRRLARAALAQMPGLTAYEVGIRLVDAAQITAANLRFLGCAGPTDVIAFDYLGPQPDLRSAEFIPLEPDDSGFKRNELRAPDFGRSRGRNEFRAPKRARREHAKSVLCARLHGDLLISLDAAQANAKRFRTSCAVELVRYVVHGLLHLRGYDDADASSRRTMKRVEDRLVRQLARRFPLRELVLERKLPR